MFYIDQLLISSHSFIVKELKLWSHSKLGYCSPPVLNGHTWNSTGFLHRATQLLLTNIFILINWAIFYFFVKLSPFFI